MHQIYPLIILKYPPYLDYWLRSYLVFFNFCLDKMAPSDFVS